MNGFVVVAVHCCFFIYCRCNQFYLLKRVVNVAQLFCFQRKKEQEMERKRKEREDKVSFDDTFKPHPPVLNKDRLMKKLLLDYFHSRNRKFKHYFKPQ